MRFSDRGDRGRADVLVEFGDSPENLAQVVGAAGHTPDFLV